MPTVIITGGTGLIGKRLSQMMIEKGYEVIVFSHQAKEGKTEEGATIKKWDINKGDIDKDAIAKADYLVHLAGANVAEKRWTEKRKQEIIDSRTKSSALLIKALRETPNQIKAVISASAIGWYGEDTVKSRSEGFSEDALSSDDFLGRTTRLWEESITPVSELEKRLVILRTGIVLSTKGGALVEFMKPLKLGVATVLGKGSQVISWIHIDDVCRLYVYAIENAHVAGIYNAAAPSPVTNKKLVTALAEEMKGNKFLTMPVPSFILKIALGEMSTEVLKSTTVSSTKTEQSGFSFLYPDIKPALHELVKK